MTELLTTQEVAELLKLHPNRVYELDIPYHQIGKGRGVRRYETRDVEAFLARTKLFPVEEDNGRRVQKKQKAVGLSRPITRRELLAIQVENKI